jgi:N-acetylmuramoyl-L-alanine amidase
VTAVVISSGHGLYVRGAAGPAPWGLDEVDEAREVVDRVGQILRDAEYDVTTFHDNTSHSQSENLNTIVNFHNAQVRDLDVSVHFNCYDTTAHGTEVLYVTQDDLADRMSQAISEAGNFTDRGPKYRSDLKFLNSTEEPAILIETCFCDNHEDCDKYRSEFEAVCMAIAEIISGQDIGDDIGDRPPRPERPPPEPVEPGETPAVRIETTGVVEVYVNGTLVTTGKPEEPAEPEEEPLAHFKGKCSWFGGPEDAGVSPSEGLAFIYQYSQAPHLFLKRQPAGTTGLARRLNPDVYYVACRWNYSATPKTMLDDKDKKALVRANNREFWAWPADWGPNENTGRDVDISPGLMDALGVDTNDTVEVMYPVAEETD